MEHADAQAHAAEWGGTDYFLNYGSGLYLLSVKPRSSGLYVASATNKCGSRPGKRGWLLPLPHNKRDPSQTATAELADECCASIDRT